VHWGTNPALLLLLGLLGHLLLLLLLLRGLTSCRIFAEGQKRQL
jgi:hypothetical protein